ncbi:MAG: CPBP family intramembrane metalloprotease [Alphaproteobacteria bacterium]|nr:CPBP family intramembrane metalloprotease [Alphaproteobacteria bacterium]MBU1515716.1 CPBP family intramembrane metalloprotease [Alphaproteobacteria bacterium]MBU2096999.1 CPBP family intramembrane metalloprotease [Alphaproteobacteria bacterium]MBU2149515.1 CPBP family intramembrane metalloprotease [Alphaproteobacteria bacterium]MBU2308901.1 CPBP family intramembrane metalloprotease [Alphaproteobacteria bacterium]
MTRPPVLPPLAFAGLYVALWGGSTAYLAFKGADWTFPLISLGIFGLALSGLAWVLTRAARPPAILVQRPTVELAAVLAFLAIYAVGFLGYGMTFVKGVFPPGPQQEVLVAGAKLLVHVALPALLLAALGARLAPLFAARANKLGFWPPLLVLAAILTALLAVVTPSLQQISGLHPSVLTLAWAAPISFIWIALEAGLAEEFLFRAVLQTRLAAVLRSELGAVVLGALIFALAHVPGLYLRGAPGVDGYSTDPLQVAAFTIATLSPIAILFGVLWTRTRSLLLVVLLHATVDFLPNLAEFLHTWA